MYAILESTFFAILESTYLGHQPLPSVCVLINLCRHLLGSVLADFGTKTSAVFLIQSTLLFAAGSLSHFLIGLYSSRVSSGRRERPSRTRESVFLLKEAQ